MKVITLFHGILAEWVGTATAEFDLPAGAVYADLLTAIGRAFRSNMPWQLWNDETNTFATPVVGTIAETQIRMAETPLRDGQEVKFYLFLTGG